MRTAGAGSAAGVVITDPRPVNTTYTANTHTLGGAPLTDNADADAGDAGATIRNTVRVSPGDLTSASGPRMITVDVKID
jgi:hypothetical protein